jgi:hypothetical protein
LGSSRPPAELARRDSALFGEVKCLFSTAPEVKKETEANEGHRGDQTLHRTWSWYDRTRPVSSTLQSGARVLWFTTGASGHSRDQRVRSGTQSELKFARSIGRATRPVTRDRTRQVVEGAYWTLTGRWHCHVRSLLRGLAVLCDRRVRSVERRVRSFARARPVTAMVTSDAHCPRLSYSDWTSPVTLTGASGQLVLNYVVQ